MDHKAIAAGMVAKLRAVTAAAFIVSRFHSSTVFWVIIKDHDHSKSSCSQTFHEKSDADLVEAELIRLQSAEAVAERT